MKRNLLVAILIISCSIANAQDTIIKINGDKIISKVIEISSTEVKYKKFDLVDGPAFAEKKSAVKLIKYANGIKEEFPLVQTDKPINLNLNTADYYTGSANSSKKIKLYGSGFTYWYHGNWVNDSKLQQILSTPNDPQLNLLIADTKKTRKLQRCGYLTIPLLLATSFLSTQSTHSSGTTSTANKVGGQICLVGTIACGITAGIFVHKHKVNNREAIQLYNSKY